MPTELIEALAERLQQECERKPDLAAPINLLVWTQIRDRIAELAEDDEREQAEDAFATLASLRPTLSENSLHRFVPLLSHARLPNGRGVSRRHRSRCNPRAEGLSHSSRRPFVAHQPNLLSWEGWLAGLEPATPRSTIWCSAN